VLIRGSRRPLNGLRDIRLGPFAVFVIVDGAEVRLAARVADDDQLLVDQNIPKSTGLLQTIKAAFELEYCR
jgi:hypothetical protein